MSGTERIDRWKRLRGTNVSLSGCALPPSLRTTVHRGWRSFPSHAPESVKPDLLYAAADATAAGNEIEQAANALAPREVPA